MYRRNGFFGGASVQQHDVASGEVQQALWQRVVGLYNIYKRHKATEARLDLIDPNRNSDVKVERLTFGLTAEVTLGTPGIVHMKNMPDTSFRPQEVHANVDSPGIFMINDLRVANVGCLIGGTVDAFALRGLKVDFPTLTPANSLVIQGMYTGKKPLIYHAKEMQEQYEAAVTEIQRLQDLMSNMGDATAKKKTTLVRVRKYIKECMAHRGAWAPPTYSPKMMLVVSFTGPAGLYS